MRLILAQPQRITPAPWQEPYPGLSGLGSSFTVTPQLQTLAQTIQTQEGYYPGSLAYQNNNPGNLVYAGQAGATKGAGGFADFATYQDGLNALYNQLNLYATGACAACGGQPLTIQQMADIYAPAGQGSNNPQQYAASMAAALGVTPDTLLSSALAGDAAIPVDPGSGVLDGTSLMDGSIDPTTFALAAAGVLAVAWLFMRK
jgi:hypothetical protein